MPDTEQAFAPPASPSDSPPADLPASAAPAAASPTERPGSEPSEADTPLGGDDTGAPPDEDEEEEGEKPPAWAGTATLEELAELDEVKGHIEGLTSKAAEQAKQQEAEHWRTRFQPMLQKQADETADINKRLHEFSASWNDWLDTVQDSGGDLGELNKLLRRHETTFVAIGGLAAQQGHNRGVDEAVTALFREAGIGNELAGFKERLGRIREGRSDPLIVPDIIEALTKGAIEKALEKERVDLEKTIRANIEAEMRAEQRKNGKPPAEVHAKGGAGKPASYRDRVGDLTPAEIDAETQRFLSQQT